MEQVPLQLLQALSDLGVGPGDGGERLLHLGDEHGEPLLGQGRLLPVARGLGRLQVDGPSVAGRGDSRPVMKVVNKIRNLTDFLFSDRWTLESYFYKSH